MNKLNYFLLGAAGLALASCSQEEVVPTINGGADGNYVVTVNLPKTAQTRAEFGTATVSQHLCIAVYDGDTGNLVDETTDHFPSGQTSTSVGFLLARGKAYDIVFFAQSEGSVSGSENTDDQYPTPNLGEGVYTFDAADNIANATVTVDYDAMTSQPNLEDMYDCFYGKLNTGVIGSGDITTEVILYRPVAQLNWGANDLGTNAAAANENAYGLGGKYVESTLIVKNAPTVLHLADGTTSGEKDVTIAAMAAPASLGTNAPAFPLNVTNGSFAYVSMAYILAPGWSGQPDGGVGGANFDVYNTFTSNNPAYEEQGDVNVATTVPVSNVPLQANYQTNIYGRLFSTDVAYMVEKMPTWWTPQNNQAYTPWDGETVTTPSQNEDGQYVIAQPSDLAGFAEMLNGDNAADYQDAEFVLEADMDMGGNSFPMIGSASRDGQEASGTAFTGVFDGNGKIISNLNVTGTTEADDATGFIANLDGENAALKNVTFKNLTINASDNEQAGVVGLLTNGATVSGVTVESGTITAQEAAAGIVGRVIGSGTVSECNNSADIVVNSQNGGGICGTAYYTENGGEILIENCVNDGTITCLGNGNHQTVGGIVGTSGATVKNCINNGDIECGTNVTTIGGIVGYQNSCGGVYDCTNNGNITGNSNIGGIIGWIGAGNYPNKEVIVVSGNVNNGNITAVGQAAGIMAFNRATCTMENNTNGADVVIKGSTVAGIVSSGFYAENPVNGGNGYINYYWNNTNEAPVANLQGTTIYETFGGVVNYFEEGAEEGVVTNGTKYVAD